MSERLTISIFGAKHLHMVLLHHLIKNVWLHQQQHVQLLLPVFKFKIKMVGEVLALVQNSNIPTLSSLLGQNSERWVMLLQCHCFQPTRTWKYISSFTKHQLQFRYAQLRNTGTNTYTKEEKYSPPTTTTFKTSLNVTAPSDVSILSSAGQAVSILKSISFAGLESGWKLWKKIWSCPDIHQLAQAILGRKETGSSDHLSLWLMLHSLLDLACASWIDASPSSPDILGRQADMHRHQMWHTEEKSTLLSIWGRDKQQAEPYFLSPQNTIKDNIDIA